MIAPGTVAVSSGSEWHAQAAFVLCALSLCALVHLHINARPLSVHTEARPLFRPSLIDAVCILSISRRLCTHTNALRPLPPTPLVDSLKQRRSAAGLLPTPFR